MLSGPSGIQARTPFLLTSIHFDGATMNLILLISNAFINTMGITQPSPKGAKRAAWFIVSMLAIVLAVIVTVAVVAIHWAAHH
jgi:hypothetical protein